MNNINLCYTVDHTFCLSYTQFGDFYEFDDFYFNLKKTLLFDYLILNY